MSEWGPWIEHDGTCVPVQSGEHYHAIFEDGDEEYATQGGDGFTASGATYKADNGSWLWREPSEPIIRYRIRKPRGLTILENLIADLPAPVGPKVDT